MRVPEEREGLRRARRLIAVQALLGVLAGVAVVGLVTLGIVLWSQRQTTGAELAQLVATGSTEGAPPGSWVVTAGADGSRSASSATPPGFPSAVLTDAAAAAGPGGHTTEVYAGGREYLTRTVVAGRRTVQAGVDLGAQESERHRLLAGLAIAALAAGLLATWLGTRLARRAVGAWDEALERQEMFVADASHELRTPLARLALRARLLEDAVRRGSPPESLAADAALLRQEAASMGEVVEDLLHAAQLGAQPEVGELVDLGEVARTVVRLDGLRAADRGVQLSSDVAPVPPVRGVEVALRRAVDALVDNALRHAASRVSVGVAEGEPSGVVVTVTDDGPGLPAENERHLFDRFARGQHTGKGFGLGLALVRDVAHRHGGRLDVQVAPGGGTCFALWLPAEPALSE